MTFTARTLWTRVYLNGVWVKTTGAVTINAALGTFARVAQFTLAEQPATTPEEGQAVLIQWLDITALTVWDLFGGTVDAIATESQPWAMTITAVDQLEKLRATRQTSDLVLTTLTEGAAWKLIMDAVGVAYDLADVADSGYVLGEQAAVSWHADGQTPASQVIANLDDVFGMATMTIGDNRVIRLPYDLAPEDATGLYATYTKGTSIDLGQHAYSRGQRDAIQNVWIVNGVGAPCGDDDACTCTVWAKAVAGNAQLGNRVRTATAAFASDLIQDEALAEAVARRKMREFNRTPKSATAAIVTDPNVHPGSKIAIVDPTYGIAAAPRYYLVTGVDSDGPRTALTLVSGPPGAEGTVTHGVTQICNQAAGSLSWPGAFSFPAFAFPPLDLGLALDFNLDLDIPFDLSGEGAQGQPDWDTIGGIAPGGGPITPGVWTVEGTISISSGSGDISLDAGVGSGWAWLDISALGSGSAPATFIFTGTLTIADAGSGLDFGIADLTNVTGALSSVWCYGILDQVGSALGAGINESNGGGVSGGAEAFTLTWNGTTLRLQIPTSSLDLSVPAPPSSSGPWHFYWFPGGIPTLSMTGMQIELT